MGTKRAMKMLGEFLGGASYISFLVFIQEFLWPGCPWIAIIEISSYI